MARPTGIHLVLPAVLCLAAHSLAADTGMLYAKSDPPGATVIIEGKERGKTPVLVKGLTPGEVTVELRFPGAKPVAKQVTVEAKRVARIDVHIELASASLTILSEPLEATVFLDNQEVGKTPLTLEDLAPGRHQLILLKDGHPRTARTVVLKPGAERVLEVKLGAAGEDETEHVTQGDASTKAQAAKSVPVEVQLILTMLKEAVDKCDYSETRRNLTLALGQPDMANFKKELRAAIGVVQALEARQDAIRDGADALVGKEVTLKTKTGSRKGRVESVLVEGITIVSKIVVARRAAGETRAVIKWTALAPEEQDRLAASWKPEGTDGAVAQALLAQARKDKAGAARALAAAGDHPLGKYLSAGSAVAAGPAEDTPKEVWARIEKRCRARRMTAAEELVLDREIRAFRRKYGGRIDSTLRRQMSSAVARTKRASGLVAHWTFDEGKGSVARDWSGRGHHGRIQGGARWVRGKIGGALRFDGVGDFVRVTDDPSFNVATFSICAWMRWEGGVLVDHYAAVSNYAGGARMQHYGLRMGNSGRAVFFYDDASKWDEVSGTSAVNDSTWHLVAGVLTPGTEARIYVDGVLEGTDTTSVPASLLPSKDLYIGRDGSHEAELRWNGLIDDVRIYNRALSAEEVKALASVGE